MWFFVALIASCLIGMSQGLGEATFLGFLKEYPSHTVGYVSSGTGFAGIFGSGTYLTFQAFDIPNQYVFIFACPTILIYFGAFSWLNGKKELYPFKQVNPDPSGNLTLSY